ncbi:olfactory receptor 1L8 [Bos taurus]|uniref:olfactory receptor 1L8 n=1 Tax=Bos taurus TaxID=9913 RepID=UPI000FC4D0AF|nr:olfactory receptor 1L8 [Bos taurus]
MTKSWTFYRNPRKERNELKFVELKFFFTIYLNICIGLCRTMERVNQTSSVSEFILLGLSSRPEDQKPLFALFFIMYVVTIVGNVLIILAIRSDTQLQTPMYFFLSILSFIDVCYTTTIVPKMLVNFLSKKKSISYAECMTQMYFFLAFANTESYLLAAMAIDRYVAICDPFHYVTTMNRHRCVLLVTFSCSISHLHSLLLVLLINRLLFCDSNIIHHFLCDINPLLKLSCSSTLVNEIVINTEGLVTLVSPFICVIISYLRILIVVLKIPSAAGKHKAFSTCGSHVTMVTLFYGSIIYVYFRPLSTYTIKDRVATVIYTILSSMLNPFLYSLRSKDMKRDLRKLMSRRMS